MMLDLLLQFNSQLNAFIWGPLLILGILGVGIYLTLGTRFVQLLKLPFVFKEIIVRRRKGVQGRLETIWSISDTLNGLMAIPNLFALVILSPVVFKLTREFFKK